MSENKDWPIHPRWLSMRKKDPESKVKPNSDGLFMPDTLLGFIADASVHSKIDNALAIFQVVPKKYKYADFEDDTKRIDVIKTKEKYINKILKQQKEESNIIRIDTGRLYDNLNCCGEFRKCTDKNKKSCEQKCHTLDSRIALLYHPDLEKHNFSQVSAFEEPNKRYEEYFAALTNVVDGYHQSLEKEKSEFKEDCVYIERFCANIGTKKKPQFYHSVYFKYRCQFSNLYEYFFPIVHSGKVIAVMMQGQRPHPKSSKESMFVDCCNKSDELSKAIEDIPNTFFLQDPFSEERKNAIFQKIRTLETRINDKVEFIAQQYVLDEFAKIEAKYREDAPNNSDNKNNLSTNFQKLSTALNAALQSILNTFSKSGFIRIYTRDSDLENLSINSTDITFSLFGETTGKNGKPAPEKLNKLIFKSLPEKDVEKRLKKLLRDPKSVLVEDDDIFRYKTQFGSKMDYVVWKRHNNWKVDFPKQHTLYKQALLALYPSLLEPYFILRSLATDETLERFMRLVVHESSQIIPSVIDAINTPYTQFIIEENKEEYNYFEVTHPVHTIIDTTRRLMLLERLFGYLKVRYKDKKVQKEWHDVHRMIYATRSLFEKKAKGEHQYLDVQFKVSRTSRLYTDYEFMSHILFNLVDNAIKYGFKGSKVVIKIEGGLSPEGMLKLSVINFGDKIEEPDKIFDWLYRSSTKKGIEGMGLGLFLVRDLCNALSYRIKCLPSKPMGDINLPLYYHYKKNYSDYHHRELSDTVMNETIDESKIEEIVNKKVGHWRISKDELEEKTEGLKRLIYKNEFVITIPIRRGTFKNKTI